MSAESQRIPWKASKARRYAKVTLHFAPVPELGGGAPYLDALNALPKGWTAVAWEHVERAAAAPPENGQALVTALKVLADEVDRALRHVRAHTKIYAEDVDHWLIEEAWEAVNAACDELPEAPDGD